VVAARLAGRPPPGVHGISVRDTRRPGPVPRARAGQAPRPDDVHERPGEAHPGAAARPAPIRQLRGPGVAEQHLASLLLDRPPRPARAPNPPAPGAGGARRARPPRGREGAGGVERGTTRSLLTAPTLSRRCARSTRYPIG